jgi:hypothetical protein
MACTAQSEYKADEDSRPDPKKLKELAKKLDDALAKLKASSGCCKAACGFGKKCLCGGKGAPRQIAAFRGKLPKDKMPDDFEPLPVKGKSSGSGSQGSISQASTHVCLSARWVKHTNPCHENDKAQQKASTTAGISGTRVNC